MHQVALEVVRASRLPNDIPHLGDAPEVWRDNDGVICARGGVIGDAAWMEILNVAIFRFRLSRHDVTAFAAKSVSEETLLDCHYRVALPLALQFFGREVLHGGAVRTDAGVVAFCAVSETGKSTMVAGLTRRGYRLWADDAVVFENLAGGVVRAIPLPCRMRLHPDAAEFLNVNDTPFEWIDPAVTKESLAAVCVLRRKPDAANGAEIRRLGSAKAFTALLPHAYCFSLANTKRKRRMIDQYFDLAAHTPVFMISFVPGFDRLPLVLDRIEAGIPAFTLISR